MILDSVSSYIVGVQKTSETLFMLALVCLIAMATQRSSFITTNPCRNFQKRLVLQYTSLEFF